MPTAPTPQNPTTSLEARRPPADAGGGAADANPWKSFLADAAAGKYGQPRVAAKRTPVPRLSTSQPPPPTVTQPIPPPTVMHPVPPPSRRRVEEEDEEHEDEEDKIGSGWRIGYPNLEALDPTITMSDYRYMMTRTCADTMKGNVCTTLSRCATIPNYFFACPIVNDTTKGRAVGCHAPFKHVGRVIPLKGNPRGDMELTIMYVNIVPSCISVLREEECLRSHTDGGCPFGHDMPKLRLRAEKHRRWLAWKHERHHEERKGSKVGKSIYEKYMDNELWERGNPLPATAGREGIAEM